MQTRKNTLLDYFPHYLTTEALFTKMATLGAPWTAEIGQDMDDAYFTMFSGIKNPSSFVTAHLNITDGLANSLTIGRVLLGIFGSNWTRLWNAMQTEYSPVNATNITEEKTHSNEDNRTINRTDNYTSTVDGTEQVTGTSSTSDHITGESNETTSGTTSGTQTLQHGLTTTTDETTTNSTWGYNSTEKVPSDDTVIDTTVSNSGSDVTTTSGTTGGTRGVTNESTETITGSESSGTTSKDTRTDKTVEDTTDMLDSTGTETMKRTGNIGYLSVQELLQQEFNLWKWNFYHEVFRDVDSYLTLSVYRCSH